MSPPRRPALCRSVVLALGVLASLAACSAPPARAPLSNAQRFNGEGLRRMNRGDVEGAEGFFRDALREAELVDDLASQASAWSNLGALATARGDAAAAWVCHATAVRLHGESGAHDEGEVRARTNLGGAMLDTGKTADARAQFARAIALAAELHRPAAAYLARIGLGSASLREGDGQGALRVALEVAADARQDADESSLSAALALAGAASESTHDLDGARARYEEALALDRAREQPVRIADDLHALARLAEAQGDRPKAASLLGRSAAVARRLGRFDAAEADLRHAVALGSGAPSEESAALARDLEALRAARAATSR